MDADARRSAYEEGKKAVETKRWTEALILFVRLWRDRPTYDVALLLGQTELNLKQYRFAAEHLSYGIANFPPRDEPRTLERAKGMLELAKAAVATIELQVTPAGSEIVIDGQTAGSAPVQNEVFLDPGEHEISATAPGHRPAATTLSVEAGETRGVNLELELEEEPGPASTPSAVETPTSPPDVTGPTVIHRASWAPVYIGGALTLAGLGAGIGFGIAANSNDGEASALRARIAGECPEADPSECARLRSLAEKGDRFETLSVAGYATAAAAGVGTIAYFLIARPDRARASNDAGGVRVTPSASLQAVGLRVAGNF